ncbi:MAG TPA: DUF4412 domain-containing protein [Ignavibacteriaceae bacterium]|nr:DUF4412 domain-containing protein [Ignavibacteriaceae bacterium]
MKFKYAGFFILCAAALVLNGKIYAQENFEGKVTFNIFDNENAEAHSMDYFMKDGKIRFDAKEKEGMGAFIMDPASKQIMIIMPEQKMYLQMQIPETKLDSKAAHEMDKGEFSKTGDTKEILGYKAEKWVFKNDTDQGEAWMTRDLGAFVWFNNPMMREDSKPQWMKDLNEGGYFPLMVTENGKKVFEVTNIQKSSVDASLFEIPAGYKKMEMPSTMQK